LKGIGFEVLALCCDEASPNRRLRKLHSDSNELVYRVPSIYAAERERFLYFISDPPHLIKTIRNSYYNKREHYGKTLDVNLRLVPKLKFEHINLDFILKILSHNHKA